MDFLYESGFFLVCVAYKIGIIADCVCAVAFLSGLVRLLVTFCCCAENTDQSLFLPFSKVGKLIQLAEKADELLALVR